MTTYLRGDAYQGDLDFTGDKFVIYICFIIILLLAAYVFFIMVLKGMALKDNYLYDMAFGKYGRFLFLPLLFTGGLCLIPIIKNSLDDYNRNNTASAVVALVFNIICLFSLIFIYCMLPECIDSTLSFVFKKCFVSATMAYHIYFFFNNVITIAYFEDPLLLKASQRNTWSWICICIFSVIIGILVWLWREVCMGVMGILFNVAFFVISSKNSPEVRIKGNYISSIIFMIALGIEVGALIFIKKKEVMK